LPTFTGEIGGDGLVRWLMLRRNDVESFEDRLAKPRFSEAEIVLPAISL